MASSSGEKELKRKWPVEDGLTAGTTTQEGHIQRLIPTERSLVEDKDKVGL